MCYTCTNSWGGLTQAQECSNGRLHYLLAAGNRVYIAHSSKTSRYIQTARNTLFSRTSSLQDRTVRHSNPTSIFSLDAPRSRPLHHWRIVRPCGAGRSAVHFDIQHWKHRVSVLVWRLACRLSAPRGQTVRHTLWNFTQSQERFCLNSNKKPVDCPQLHFQHNRSSVKQS
jgi:hypothetical protein